MPILYANSELIDLETPNILKSSQFVKRIALAPTDFLSSFNDAPALDANKTPQLQGVTLTPTIYMSNSSEDKCKRNSNNLKICQLIVHS